MNVFSDPQEAFLLDYLITKLENGSNTRNALVLYNEQITKQNKFKIRLENVIKELEKGKDNLEVILHKYGFLNEFEFGLVSNSINIVDGLKLVKKISKDSSNLLRHMLKPIFLPLTVIIGVFLSLWMYLGILNKEVSELTKTTPELVQYMDIPTYFNYPFAISGFSIFMALTLFLFFGYLYFYIKKPEIVYKILSTQVYADGKFLFRILHEMLSVGIPLHKASEILSNNYYKKGLRPFFKDISTAISKKHKLFEVFEKYNFPLIITSDIKMSELTSVNYTSITKSIYQTCDTMYEQGIKFLIMQWTLFSWLLAALITVIICTDILNLVIGNFTFKLLYA